MEENIKMGLDVNSKLVSLGIETPALSEVNGFKTFPICDAPKVFHEQLQQRFSEIMELLCIDLDNDSTVGTPKRLAKMYKEDLFFGMNYVNFPSVLLMDANSTHNPVISAGIEVKSICEHHFMPIYGKATVIYIPHKKVIGLSKINRIVNFFSRRPSIQERLTRQIYETFKLILGTDQVAVILNCDHFCIKHRGVGEPNGSTITFAGSGIPKELLQKYL